MFGVMQSLNIEICESPEDATAKGYVYREGFKPIEVEKVVVVRNGTKSGKPSVDFIMVDGQGNKFVVMLTGALVKSIPC